MKYDKNALRNAVDWEGGAYELFKYGLSHEGIEDPELAELWRKIESMYVILEPILDKFDELIYASEN